MGSLVQLTLGLLAVLAAIALVAWLMRRVGRFQSGVGGAMRIVGGLSMGARERVVLIQVGETQLLLGVAPGRVQTLHVMQEPIAEDSEGAGAGRFAQKLRAALDKRASS
ncbi:MAG: flagellar biosynthetic protein FliO [Gammaproteobacteria bacterium]